MFKSRYRKFAKNIFFIEIRCVKIVHKMYLREIIKKSDKSVGYFVIYFIILFIFINTF